MDAVDGGCESETETLYSRIYGFDLNINILNENREWKISETLETI